MMTVVVVSESAVVVVTVAVTVVTVAAAVDGHRDAAGGSVA